MMIVGRNEMRHYCHRSSEDAATVAQGSRLLGDSPKCLWLTGNPGDQFTQTGGIDVIHSARYHGGAGSFQAGRYTRLVVRDHHNDRRQSEHTSFPRPPATGADRQISTCHQIGNAGTIQIDMQGYVVICQIRNAPAVWRRLAKHDIDGGIGQDLSDRGNRQTGKISLINLAWGYEDTTHFTDVALERLVAAHCELFAHQGVVWAQQHAARRLHKTLIVVARSLERWIQQHITLMRSICEIIDTDDLPGTIAQATLGNSVGVVIVDHQQVGTVKIVEIMDRKGCRRQRTNRSDSFLVDREAAAPA